MKKCPFCAEEIQEAAIKCRHCGSMLNHPIQVQGADAHDSPRVLYAGAPSWKAHFARYAGVFALVALAVAAAIGAHLQFEWEWQRALIPGAVLAVAALVLLVQTELQRRSLGYRITNRTIDVERGIVSRTIDTFQLWRVSDVQFEQSLVERSLGLATIRVYVQNGAEPAVVLKGLSGARKIFDDVKTAVDAARKAGNVVGMVE